VWYEHIVSGILRSPVPVTETGANPVTGSRTNLVVHLNLLSLQMRLQTTPVNSGTGSSLSAAVKVEIVEIGTWINCVAGLLGLGIAPMMLF
jgi:hypothetical protein